MQDRFHLRALALAVSSALILTACGGVAFLMPYLQLQLTGLGLIIETCSYGVITRVPAMLIAFTLVAAFVYTSGLQGVASAAGIKDALLRHPPNPQARFVAMAVSRTGMQITRS